MSFLEAQRRAVVSAKLRNRQIRALCALLQQLSHFDRDVEEALKECTPASRAVIRRICDQATDGFADVFCDYLLANESNPFRKDPKPNTDTNAD